MQIGDGDIKNKAIEKREVIKRFNIGIIIGVIDVDRVVINIMLGWNIISTMKSSIIKELWFLLTKKFCKNLLDNKFWIAIILKLDNEKIFLKLESAKFLI